MKKTFDLVCMGCGQPLPSFREYFDLGQQCPSCAEAFFTVRYRDYAPLHDAVARGNGLDSIWRYRDLLPVMDRRNIVTAGEGAVAIEPWPFLADFARERHHLDIAVHVHRFDNCNATGTFKDLAASVASSVLRENRVPAYVASSTGNIGVAYSRYLAQAGVTFYVFVPGTTSLFHTSEIACFGQKAFQVDGDYRAAKDMAAAFARRENMLTMAGTFDPLRLEAKKTMAYEWVRQMDEPPTVYIQALSGGTGPIGVYLGCRDLLREGLLSAPPRFVLVQSDACAPMARAWKDARREAFPPGWERCYPVLDDPRTEIVTLATGNPTAYPRLAPLVRETRGAILAIPEKKAVAYARLAAFEAAVRIGPAAAVAVGGFFQALEEGELKNGDVVLINIGEGMRRAPDFMQKMLHSLDRVRTVDECGLFSRTKYREQLWQEIVS